LIRIRDGSDQTFTITATRNGYRIHNLLIDGVSVGSAPTYTFSNVITDHTISTDFEFIPPPIHLLIPTDIFGGTISPNGDVAVEEGADQTFTFIPINNYRVVDVVIDGTSVGNITSYTLHNVTNANHTFFVDFELIPPSP
jgi:hypothetical protein